MLVMQDGNIEGPGILKRPRTNSSCGSLIDWSQPLTDMANSAIWS